MLKKVLAASSAAVVALSALATTAMADGVSPIVINAPKSTNKYVEFDLQGEINGLDLYKLLVKGNAVAADMSDPQEWDKLSDMDNSYNHMLMAVWVNPDEHFWAMDENWKDLDWYNDPWSKTTLVENTKDGWKSRVNASGGNYVEIKSVEFATELFASVQKYQALSTSGNTITYEENGDPTSDSTSAKASGSGDFVSANGNPGGVTTKPVDLSASFGLNAKKALKSIDFDNTKSNVTVKFTVKMDANVFRGLGKGKADGMNWTWGASGDWSNASEFFKGDAGTETLNKYFGIVGTSGTYNKETNQYTQVGSVGTGVRVKMIGDARDAGSTEKIGALPLPTGTIPIGVGQNATIPQLKALNNGGTIEFEFDKDVNSLLTVGSILIMSGSGQVALPLGQDYDYSEGGKKLTMKFGAGLTFSDDMLNSLNAFKFVYNITTNSISGIVPGGLGGDNTSGTLGGTNQDSNKNYNGKLIKVTITPNASAPTPDNNNSNSNGGLVEKPDNSTSTSTSTSTPSTNNSGSTNNGEKNPGTGVAVAVAPVVLATAAAAVVISKKRK